MPLHFSLRPLTPEVSRASLNTLCRAAPDAGAITFAFEYLERPYAVLEAMHGQHDTVLAEVEGHDNWAGAGTISWGRLALDGQVVTAGYNNTLMVHPAFRGKGLGRALGAWRMERLRRRWGPDAVSYASIQASNIGSEKTALSWAQHFSPSSFLLYAAKTRPQPVAALPNYRVGPLEVEDIPALVEHLNRFYRDYELYVPLTVEALGQWLAHRHRDTALHHYWVVKDRAGNLLAGIGLKAYYSLHQYTILHLATYLKWLNVLLRLVPTNGILRQMSTDKFWYAPHQAAAARYLWEHLRYAWHDRVDTLIATMDERGPFPKVLGLSRFAFTTRLNLALRSPIAPDAQKLWYFQTGV